MDYTINNNLIFEFIKSDYLFNNNINERFINYKLNFYLENNFKNEFIKEYFNYINKDIITEGLVAAAKSLVRWIIETTKSLKNIILKKAGDSKIGQKIKNDKDFQLAGKAFKMIGSSAATAPIFMAIRSAMSPLSMSIRTALLSVGAPSWIPTVITFILLMIVSGKVISFIKKFVTMVVGAIKKWAYSDAPKEQVKKESVELAKASMRVGKQVINKIEDPDKKRKYIEKFKEKENKIKQEINKSKSTA